MVFRRSVMQLLDGQDVEGVAHPEWIVNIVGAQIILAAAISHTNFAIGDSFCSHVPTTGDTAAVWVWYDRAVV